MRQIDDASDEYGDRPTESTGPVATGLLVQRFRLQIEEGPQRGQVWESSGDRCSIGSHPSNDLVLDDPTVSRFHCEIALEARGARVRDLDSKNGTVVDGVVAVDAFLREGSRLRLGRSVVHFQLASEQNRLPLSERCAFGTLVGASGAMRATFALLERAAASDATVLIEGETGTGKEVTAQSIHDCSPRAQGPFVVVDCAAIPASLLESELFGYERGAFTGAVARRIGAFEEASGGTLVLDEIGELPAELQPKLLRAIEEREVRRLGGSGYSPIDVRIVVATNRDLRAEVNAGRFRSDLFFRLAVVWVRLPALRTRPEDLPLLVERMLESLGATPDACASLCTQEMMARLGSYAWPGNVRELRNYLERCLVVREPLPLADERGPSPPAVDASRSYEEERRRAIAQFERVYIQALLQRHGGKVAPAARAAGIDRVYLHRLLRRHGVKGTSA